MERFKAVDIIRTGLVRVLLSLSGFLVRVTGLINAEKNSRQTADDDTSMDESPDSWPAEWTQRIKSAQHVTWFSFKAKRNALFQGQRSVKSVAHQDGVPTADLRDSRDSDVSSIAHEPRSGSKSVPSEDSVPISRVFDPRTRLWVYESSGEPSPARPDQFSMNGGLPVTGPSESEKTDANPGLAPFPFHTMKSAKPQPESTGSRVDSFDLPSFDLSRNSREARPESDAQPVGYIAETNRFENPPIQTMPRSGVRFSETPRDTTKGPSPNVQEIRSENVPPYHRWTEIGSFDDSSAPPQKIFFSSPENTGVKEQGASPKEFNDNPAPALNRPWPELEEFEFPRETITTKERGDSHRRLIKLKHEQKGSLWSVSRF